MSQDPVPYGVVLGSVFVVHLLAMLSPGPNVLVVTQTAASRNRRAACWWRSAWLPARRCGPARHCWA